EYVFTVSTLQQTSSRFIFLSSVSMSTYTISPSSRCAKSVMPITAVSPSMRTHSCSLVYFSSPGKFIILVVGCWLLVIRCSLLVVRFARALSDFLNKYQQQTTSNEQLNENQK